MASINPIASSPLRPEQRLSTRDDLFSAIRENNQPRVEELIEQDVDLKTRDQDGNGPLYWALINDNPEITRLLLQKRADPNEKMNRPYAYTALHMIAERKANFHALLLQELCDRRADLNARAYGQLTPLMVAAYRGNTPMVSFLADKGADVHLRDAHDNTALHWAVQPWLAQAALSHYWTSMKKGLSKQPKPSNKMDTVILQSG